MKRKRAKRVWRAARRSLHGWLLSYAELRNTSIPEIFVYREKNLWATKYWILSHFWTRSFCHLELGILLKPVFSNIRFSIFFWNSLQHRAEQSHLSKNRGGTRRLTMRTFKEKAISSKEWSWKKLSRCCLLLGVKLNNLRQSSKKKKKKSLIRSPKWRTI